LATFKPTDVRQVLLLDGYSGSQDGGGGQFYWDSTYAGAGNGITIIVPSYVGYTTGAWMRQWDHERIDARWGGAQPGVTSDANTSRMQAVLNAAGAQYIAYFAPNFTWNTTFPLVCGTNQTMRGGLSSASGVAKTSFANGTIQSFPMFWAGGASYFANGTPTYVSRGGFDWLVLTEASTNSIAFSEYPHVRLHGQAQLCVETMIRVTAPPGGLNTKIVTSYGRESKSSAITNALTFEYQDLGGGNYGVAFHLQTNGTGGSAGSYTLGTIGTAFTGGVDTKLAVSYDGVKLRIYVNGVYNNSLAVDVPGETISKGWYENLNCWIMSNEPYNATIGFIPPNAQFTGLRVSNIARYTDQVTPYAVETSPLAADGHTMALLTFAAADRHPECNCIVAHEGIGLGDVWYEWQGNLAQSVAGVTFYDLAIQNNFGHCISLQATPSWRVERCTLTGLTCINNKNNCYTGVLRDTHMSSSFPNGFSFDSRFWCGTVLLRDASGLVEVQTCQIRGSAGWSWIVSNATIRLQKCYSLSGDLGVYYVVNGFIDCDSDFPTDEGSIGPQRAVLWLNNSDCIYVGPALQSVQDNGAQALCVIDGGGSQYFFCGYETNASFAAFSFLSAPDSPVVADGNNSSTITAPCKIVDPNHPGLVHRASALVGIKAIALSGTTRTLTDNEYMLRNKTRFTGALAADCTITIPYITVDGYERVWWNDTTGGHNLVIQGATGTGVTIAAGASARTITKGGNVVVCP
jgi:hypothetical protein